MSNQHLCLDSSLAIAFLWAFYYPLVLSASCQASIYGVPYVQDCYEALYLIPSARQVPSDPISQQPRVFAESQYLQTSFSGVNNAISPHAIIQLPKIWKHSRYIFVRVRKSYGIPRRSLLLPCLLRRPSKRVFSAGCFDIVADYNRLTESCNVALVTHGNPRGGVSVPEFVIRYRRGRSRRLLREAKV